METFVMWAGAVGAWLLVAGPLFQGSLELGELAEAGPVWSDQKPIDRALWLMPPVLYLVQIARYSRARAADGELSASFTNRATGWFTVAAGAALVAVKEMWELAGSYEWPLAVYWAVVVLLALACQANVTVRMLRLTRSTHELEHG